MDDFENITKELLDSLNEGQKKAVFEQPDCDIDPSFIGFVDIYYHLAKIIPLHWFVVDFGCAYAPQSYFFRFHRGYYGVDPFDGFRFFSDNTIHKTMTAEKFIEGLSHIYNPSETFAICSYVPSQDNKLIRDTFPNVFCFYPSNKEHYKQLFSDFRKK